MSFLTHEYIDLDNVALDFAKGDSIIFTNHHHEKVFESASLIKLPIMIYIYESTTQEDRKVAAEMPSASPAEPPLRAPLPRPLPPSPPTPHPARGRSRTAPVATRAPACSGNRPATC